MAKAEQNEKTKMSSVDSNVEFSHDADAVESVSKDEQPPRVAAPVLN